MKHPRSLSRITSNPGSPAAESTVAAVSGTRILPAVVESPHKADIAPGDRAIAGRSPAVEVVDTIAAGHTGLLHAAEVGMIAVARRPALAVRTDFEASRSRFAVRTAAAGLVGVNNDCMRLLERRHSLPSRRVVRSVAGRTSVPGRNCSEMSRVVHLDTRREQGCDFHTAAQEPGTGPTEAHTHQLSAFATADTREAAQSRRTSLQTLQTASIHIDCRRNHAACCVLPRSCSPSHLARPCHHCCVHCCHIDLKKRREKKILQGRTMPSHQALHRKTNALHYWNRDCYHHRGIAVPFRRVHRAFARSCACRRR